MTVVQPLLVGVDVGGTKIAVLITTPDGVILGRATRASSVGDQDGAAEAIATTVETALLDAGASVDAVAVIGVGVPGRVDPLTGRVTIAVNLGWTDLALRDALEARLGRPCVIENDARASRLRGASLGPSGAGGRRRPRPERRPRPRRGGGGAERSRGRRGPTTPRSRHAPKGAAPRTSRQHVEPHTRSLSSAWTTPRLTGDNPRLDRGPLLPQRGDPRPERGRTATKRGTHKPPHLALRAIQQPQHLVFSLLTALPSRRRVHEVA